MHGQKFKINFFLYFSVIIQLAKMPKNDMLCVCIIFKGLHIIYRGCGAGNIHKKLFEKVIAPSKEHDKNTLARMQLLQEKSVPRMLKKFIYLSGKVLLLFLKH